MSLKGKKYIKDTFCIAPWNSMHFGVKKEVLPCCQFDYVYPIGSLTETDNLEEIYNSDRAKEVRSSLFSGNRIKECKSCWQAEKISKNESYRQFHNKYFGEYIDEALENTNEDFSLKEIKLRRLDIRFDNKCNLKCRICNSDYSTSWYADDVKLGRKPKEKTDVYKQTISSKVFDFIIEQLANVDEIFFAGGEPLMQDGHYLILEKAIELGYNDRIRLTYNTNFSSLKYKNKNIISLWKQFTQVNIGASLDASHKRGEYQRKNIVWQDVVDNRKTILDKLPESKFTIIPTVGILNVYNILEFHKEWVMLGFLKVNDIQINLLRGPDYYNIQNLPPHHKSKIKKLYKEHLEWIDLYENSETAKNEFLKVINYIDTRDMILSELEEFVDYNKKLDNIRDESFFDIFDEYTDLEYYISYEKLKNDVGETAIETIGEQKEKIKKYHEAVLKLQVERDDLNKKLAEKDSFISKALFDKTYIQELETLRDELNKKVAEKDSFINKALFDKGYVSELETLRDELNKKVAEKDSFINKTLIDTNYLSEVINLKSNLDSLKTVKSDEADKFFTQIESISNRISDRIRLIKKQNDHKVLL